MGDKLTEINLTEINFIRLFQTDSTYMPNCRSNLNFILHNFDRNVRDYPKSGIALHFLSHVVGICDGIFAKIFR
jgi:hypothetical protein